MEEFLTQPIQGWQLLVVLVAVILGWIMGLIMHYASMPSMNAHDLKMWALNKFVIDDSFDIWRDYWNDVAERVAKLEAIEPVNEEVAELSIAVDSMSDTLWAIEDDVEAMKAPGWKKLLRKITE